MPETSLVRRAVAALKSAVPFSGWGGTSGGLTSGYGYAIDDNILNGVWRAMRRYTGTNIDYSAELGDLLNHSIVMAAVNWVARALPEAPLNIVQLNADNTEVIQRNHPAATLLRYPNPYFTGGQMWKAFAAAWLCAGNVYYLKGRDNRGKLQQLWFAPPSMIEPRWPDDGSQFISHYIYRVDGRPYPVQPEDIIHFKEGADPNNLRVGLSPLAPIYREIYGDSQAANFHALMLASGAVPPLIITPAESAADVDAATVKQRYLESTQGDNRGKVFVSNGQLKVEKLAWSPKELDFTALRKFPEGRLCSVLGISAVTLGFTTEQNSTYNNNEQADERSYENFMVPLWRYIEEALNQCLLPEFNVDPVKYSYRFDLSKVRCLSVDEDALYKRINESFKSNWITRGEARKMVGLDATDDDDVFYSEVFFGAKVKADMEAIQLKQDLMDANAAANPQQPLDPGQAGQEGKPVPNGQAIADTENVTGTKGMEQYTGGLLYAPLPPDLGLAVRLAAAELPGDIVMRVPDVPHLTIRSGLLNTTVYDIANLLKEKLLLQPFEIVVDSTQAFIQGDADILHILTASAFAEVLNQEVNSRFESAHVTFAHQYIPHITIAYLKPGTSAPYVDNKALGVRFGTFTVDHLIYRTQEGNEYSISLKDNTANIAGVLSIKKTPQKAEITAARNKWRKRAPDAAIGLIDAKAK